MIDDCAHKIRCVWSQLPLISFANVNGIVRQFQGDRRRLNCSVVVTDDDKACIITDAGSVFGCAARARASGVCIPHGLSVTDCVCV